MVGACVVGIHVKFLLCLENIHIVDCLYAYILSVYNVHRVCLQTESIIMLLIYNSGRCGFVKFLMVVVFYFSECLTSWLFVFICRWTLFQICRCWRRNIHFWLLLIVQLTVSLSWAEIDLMIFTFSKIFDFTQFDCLKTCFVAKCKVCSVQFHHIASRFSFRIHRVKLGRASNNAKSVWVPYFCSSMQCTVSPHRLTVFIQDP